MDFSLMSFFITQHFWQFLFVISFCFFSTLFVIFYFWFSAYPEIVLNKLSLIKYIGLGVSTLKDNKYLEKGIQGIEKTEESYDLIISKFYGKTFFPVLFFLFFNFGLGYFIYFVFLFFDNTESSFILNIVIFIVSFPITKRIFFNKI